MRQIQANLRDTSNTAKISWNNQNIIFYGGWYEVDQDKKKLKTKVIWKDSRYTVTMRFYRGVVPKIHGTQLQASE